MPSFFTAAHLKLSLLLSILGALVALIFTILSDSGVVALIARPLVSALLMFVLGSALYALLAKKVPEAIEVIEHAPDEGGALPMEGEMPEGETGGSELAVEGSEYNEDSGSSMNDRAELVMSSTPARQISSRARKDTVPSTGAAGS